MLRTCFAPGIVATVSNPGSEVPGKRGRPRAADARRPGASGADEILDAAAELFSSRGYAATSTRAIAEAVGMRQASLYHYFSTKDEILTALLETTVQGPLQVARAVAESDGAPLDRLLELAAFDTDQLLAAKYNLGALYHLPELAGDGFAEFRRDRAELAELYRSLAAAAIGDENDLRCLLPFRLVESVIGMRSDGALPLGPESREQIVATICSAIRAVVTHPPTAE